MSIHGDPPLAVLQGTHCRRAEHPPLATNHVGAIPELKPRKITTPSHREKGLSSATEEIFPHAYRGYYYQHVAENMLMKFGLAVRDTFWKLAKGRSILVFDDVFKELHSLKAMHNSQLFAP